MYSNKFEYDRRWQYGDRNPRDDGNTRWKERPGAHSDAQRGSYHKYGGEAHTSAERTSGSKEYSDSPQRPYYKEQLNRERSRKSPVRRRPSSPEWSVSEKRRRRYTVDDEADFRYRYESEDKMYKYSPDDSQRTHASKDFKRATPPEEDFKYRKTPQEPRPRQQHEDFTYRHEPEDFSYRRPSYKDRDGQERSHDHSAERTRPQEFPMKTSAKAREKHYSPTDREDHQPRTRFPLNGSRGEVYERDVGNPAPVVPDQKTKGFQRFLDVLNKGVDISALKKFAKPSSSGEDHQPPSPASHSSATDQPGAPSWPRKRRTPENSGTWSQSKGSRGDAAPQPSHRSFSPKRRSPSHEKSHQRSEAGGSHFSSNSRSRSPTEVEKRTMTPEEEHKHRQMQDVLHAIGMDLGFEELGQMSSRIQERLYGKKDGDRSRRHKDHRENTRPAFSPQRRSRSSTSSSSSSRSNYSPLTRGSSPKNDSYKGERDVTKATEASDNDYAPHMSSSVLQDTGRSDNNSQESSVSSSVCSLIPTFPTYSTSTQPPAPLMPTYPPVHYSPYSLYPPLPPVWAPVGHRPLLPTPFFPFPHAAPQLNIHPALIAQVTHAFPQPVPNYPPPLLNMQDANKQKAKTQSRPRCLQVIDTQQTG
ncbi:uncharacterized protein LOC142994924 [Genypterus blacodes]|uniref:uncharacterized protein LOC142994924 n=1 Tax=Genypterus blacodes TaxID=154954 RepID=UPI003F76BA36